MAVAKKKVTPRRQKGNQITERNIELLGQVMQYLLAEPQVFDALPSNFELVLLPEDDPEIRLYNLELLDRFGRENKPVVFARIGKDRGTRARVKPDLYVPLAA